MKQLCLLVICFSLSCGAMAQSKKDSIPRIRSVGDIGWAVCHFYQPNKDSLKNACWSGCVFIRFDIDDNRQFINIAYTKTTPRFIVDALNNSFDQINSYGVALTQLNINKKQTYILPLVLGHNHGCGFLSGWEDKIPKRDAKTQALLDERQSNYNQALNSLWNMMSFSDGDFRSINCILLAPAHMGFTMY